MHWYHFRRCSKLRCLRVCASCRVRGASAARDRDRPGGRRSRSAEDRAADCPRTRESTWRRASLSLACGGRAACGDSGAGRRVGVTPPPLLSSPLHALRRPSPPSARCSTHSLRCADHFGRPSTPAAAGPGRGCTRARCPWTELFERRAAGSNWCTRVYACENGGGLKSGPWTRGEARRINIAPRHVFWCIVCVRVRRCILRVARVHDGGLGAVCGGVVAACGRTAPRRRRREESAGRIGDPRRRLASGQSWWWQQHQSRARLSSSLPSCLLWTMMIVAVPFSSLERCSARPE